jgi:hypothetical protein
MKWRADVSLLGALFAGVLLASACGSDSEGQPGKTTDAGTDQSSVDAGPDAALDGSSDGAVDSGVPPTDVPWASEFSLPKQDSAGFSTFEPSSDSRIVYVSDSAGDDATGATYDETSPEVGADPFNPTGTVKAFKTIDAGLTAVRSGYPDWVLLRRGDSWTITATLDAKSGRSADERFLISAYGPGADRPLIRTGTVAGLRFWKDVQFSAATGLHFYANGRDPDGSDFVGFANVGAASGFTCWAEDPTPTRTILVEDCAFDFYGNNVIQGPASPRDIVVRRNIITNNYSASSHSQGMYSKGASILLEENLFDHNGWYKQSYVQLNDQAEGQATFFNHNTYFTNTNQTIFRRNLFLRASSIGNKFTANPEAGTDVIMAEDVLLDDNFYVEGEIGVSAGGNTDNGDGSRFKNFIIVNNVLMSIGRARPTNRSLGWGIDVNDWEGGKVAGNVFSLIGDPQVKNIYAIHLIGHSTSVEVADNLMYGLDATQSALKVDGDPKSQISITGNELQFVGTQMRFVDTDYTAAGTFASNTYYTDATANPFTVNGSGTDFAGWQAAVGDPGAQQKQLTYPEPDRSIESYAASLGTAATLEAFIAEAKKQSKQNWRPAYTAQAVNAYIRAGFGKP